jgi:FtsP/CotA-like multicopper oxidase with cupredoxin domain
MLQEQIGVFGAIVIHPKEKNIAYDKDLVLLVSDWTNENPMKVLKNLKRGSEWYGVKKGTNIPLNQVIKKGAFGAQLKFWKQRMEGADIADIYYPAFLINGEKTINYPNLKAGEKVRLRIIDGAASTNFWITFGGGNPVLVSADGLDVVPVKKNKIFIAIAEAYDFIITIPENKKIEFKITAQDGSGTASAYLGNGKTLKAASIPKPDKIEMMKKMAKMDMKMGAHALKFRPKKDERFKMKKEYGMQMKTKNVSETKAMKMPMDKSKGDKKASDKKMKMKNPYNYDYLKSPNKTTYDKNIPVNEILLNLTGNMQRYIWSMNGVPLSETDKIKIKGNQVTRITLNNLTMMHHPMHLHGHFFRVLNKNGEYSPLKHTVNVPPMQSVTIEFYGNEYGDWFFHCHILYHMMGGMARVFSYDTPRDPRMKNFPVKKLIAETDRYFGWGTIDLASNLTSFRYTTSNIRNQFNFSAEYGYNKNGEAEITYEYYLHDYLRVFGGVNVENKVPNNVDDFNTTAVVGIRYLTPYLFGLDVRVDSELKPRISLSRSIMLFKKFAVFGYFEHQMDFGLVNTLSMGSNFENENVWNAGAEYLLSRDFSFTASYDNRYGAGAGLSIRF